MNHSPPDTALLQGLTVLFVEDDADVRLLLGRILGRRVGRVHTAENGQAGLEAFRAHQPDVVVTDLLMPVMDGLTMAQEIKSQGGDTPIVVITAHTDQDYFLRAIDIGIDKYVTKPVNQEALLEAVQQAALERFHHRELEQAKQDLIDTLHQTIAVLGRALESRDPYTVGHQKRVSLLAVALARELGLPEHQVDGIRLGSLIHDLGKIQVPAEILSCPRPLSDLEFALLKQHPATGHDILAGVRFPWPVAEMVWQHHEHLDGSGYPRGLQGREIILEARILTVADVVESIASHRPYRPAWGMDKALEEITTHSGAFYDPRVVRACLTILEREGEGVWTESRDAEA